MSAPPTVKSSQRKTKRSRVDVGDVRLRRLRARRTAASPALPHPGRPAPPCSVRSRGSAGGNKRRGARARVRNGGQPRAGPSRSISLAVNLDSQRRLPQSHCERRRRKRRDGLRGGDEGGLRARASTRCVVETCKRRACSFVGGDRAAGGGAQGTECEMQRERGGAEERAVAAARVRGGGGGRGRGRGERDGEQRRRQEEEPSTGREEEEGRRRRRRRQEGERRGGQEGEPGAGVLLERGRDVPAERAVPIGSEQGVRGLGPFQRSVRGGSHGNDVHQDVRARVEGAEATRARAGRGGDAVRRRRRPVPAHGAGRDARGRRGARLMGRERVLHLYFNVRV